MPDEPKTRTLTYRRAQWFRRPPARGSLEQLIGDALAELPNVDDNRVDRGAGVAETRHYDITRRGIYLHIVAYVPGESATIVPYAEDVAEANLAIAAPPEGTEFADGDVTLRVSGDHVIICPSGLREGGAANYLRSLFRKAQLADEARDFDLAKIANPEMARRLAAEGVKKVGLDVAMYDASVDEIERRTVQRSLGRAIRDNIWDLLGDDPQVEELQHAENLQAKLILSFDGRKQGAVLAKEQLSNVASLLVDEEDEGFVIYTEGGNIRADEIAVKKPVELHPLGKSVDHVHAWHEIDRFFNELEESGVLEL